LLDIQQSHEMRIPPNPVALLEGSSLRSTSSSVDSSDPKIGSTRPFSPKFWVFSTQGIGDLTIFGLGRVNIVIFFSTFFKSGLIQA
jgi:hypothetical protein